MKINPDKFWVVTKATKDSELGDVCFETSLFGLGIQYKGGLEPRDVVGLYTTEKEALAEALKQLKLILKK